MQFIDSHFEGLRIYVGALDAGRGAEGFTAALVITRERDGHPSETHYRDDRLACGHRWPSAEQAMNYAMARGREMVRRGHFDPPLQARRAA